MYKLLAFLFLWSQSYISLAQSTTNSVRGTVKDINNDAIPGATVRLLNSSDSTLIKGAISDGKGIFEIKSIDNGSYLLSISAVGQKRYDLSFNIDDTKRNIVLPIISLMPADYIQLKEVVVKSKRPLIEQQVDRTVVNVESMISAASSNAIEVLEKTPGVVVNSNGAISLNGREVCWYLSMKDLLICLHRIYMRI